MSQSTLNSTRKPFCAQVSNRKATYESKMETQKGLLELGKTMALREKKNLSNREKHAYLMSAVKELDEFDGNMFMTEYELSKDLNLLKAKSYSLVRYISIFKELHNSNVEQIKTLKAEINELQTDVEDQSEQIDNYISQLDETDNALAGQLAKLIKQKREISELKKTQTNERATAKMYKFTFFPMLTLCISMYIYIQTL